MMTRGKVVLFYPPYDGPPLGAPLSLLALAGTLQAAAFEVVLIDAVIEPDYLLRIEEECKSALCMGISVLNRSHDSRRDRSCQTSEKAFA